MMKKISVSRGAWARWGLLAALSAAAVFLWVADGRDQAQQPVQTPAPIAQTDERLRRETAYSRDVEALRKLTQSEEKNTREHASEQLSRLIAEHQQEIALETALAEAGFPAAVVIVQNNAVTVMLPQEQLNADLSAQILALCIAHTDAGAQNVRIMPVAQTDQNRGTE